MALEVRTIQSSEFPSFVACAGAGFFHPVADGYPEYFLGDVDLDRTWAAFDGGGLVGTLRSFATELTVPGPAHVPAAALTNVTVAPTHRRQGLLTEMISGDLRAARDRGEHVGMLIASEFPIYGRFGYGAAVEGARYTVRADHARFREAGAGTMERVTLAALRQVAPAVYDRFRLDQPGSIERSARWWDRVLHQVEVPGADPSTDQAAIYRSPGGDLEGYVRYQGKQSWEDMRPTGVLTVEELVATTPAAYQGLWRYCCDIDLITTVEAGDRCVEEPLGFLLTDGRAVRQTGRYDFIWVRVLDPCAALAARRYRVEGRIVIEIIDPLGFASGRYALEGGPTGANCCPVHRGAGGDRARGRTGVHVPRRGVPPRPRRGRPRGRATGRCVDESRSHVRCWAPSVVHHLVLIGPRWAPRGGQCPARDLRARSIGL